MAINNGDVRPEVDLLALYYPPLSGITKFRYRNTNRLPAIGVQLVYNDVLTCIRRQNALADHHCCYHQK